jgi:hypothetical protein
MSGEKAGNVGGLECVGHFYEWGKSWKGGWSGVSGTLVQVEERLERCVWSRVCCNCRSGFNGVMLCNTPQPKCAGQGLK